MAKIRRVKFFGVLVVLGIIFWSVAPFTALAQPTQPNKQANALEQKAQTYFKNNQYAEAEQVYKSIIQGYPKTDYEFRAQKDLATLYIKMGNIKSAQKTTDTLLNNFSNHPDIAKALLEIGSSYSEKGKEDEAIQLHEYNVRTFPKTEFAMWSQMHIAMSNIRIGNDAAAEAAIDKLLADFSGNEYIAQAVHEIAGHCNWLQKHEKALELHQYVLDNWPRSEQAIWSQMGVAVSNIALGKMEDAQAAVDKLLTGFSGNKHIAQAVHEIAGHYRWSKKYEKSNQLHQYVLDNWPGSQQAFWSQMGVAMANIALNKTEAAQAAIDKLLADFSGNKHIAQAVHEIAGHCNWLEKHEKALELHQYVLDNWPRSEQAFWSQMGVAVSNIALGKTEAAQAAVDKLLARYPKDESMANAVCQIADEYCKQANHDKALELYQKASELYQHTATTWPDSGNAIRTNSCKIKTNILLDNIPNVKVAINELLAEFPYHSDLPDTLYQVAMTLQLQGRYEEAIEAADMGIASFTTAYPTDHNYYLKGLCYAQLNNYEEALTWYDKLLREFPNSDIANNAKMQEGRVLYFQGKYQDAVDTFKDVLASNPSENLTKEAKQNIEDIERLFLKKQ
ncbi:tetratricopeptide repeat protein [Patescibacteria group bacterium]|nr:tetratricopeptide repeat protein [Patescibacteria group bacterium]MBU1891121.1 tetratricopeptide repeat protein [Patescibacteria group bacterium]